MKVFFLHDQHHNAGDMLSKPILEHFGYRVELVDRHVRGKVIAVGSVMSCLRRCDTVWGAGCIRDKAIIAPPGATFLAVRGPLTRALIKGAEVPEIYGDPALLLPLLRKPTAKKYGVGIVPHYVDKAIAPIETPIGMYGEAHFIDIQAPWQQVVDEITACEHIVSSSLHGLVIAEAYGIPATWVKYSDNIIGGGFKFRDYYLGTGRHIAMPGQEAPAIDGLVALQDGLVQALKKLPC